MKKKILTTIILFSFIFLFSVNGLQAGWGPYIDYDYKAKGDCGGGVSTATYLYVDDNYSKHIWVKVKSNVWSFVPVGYIAWRLYKAGVKFDSDSDFFGGFSYGPTKHFYTWLNNEMDWVRIATIATITTGSFPYLSTMTLDNWVRADYY